MTFTCDLKQPCLLQHSAAFLLFLRQRKAFVLSSSINFDVRKKNEGPQSVPLHSALHAGLPRLGAVHLHHLRQLIFIVNRLVQQLLLYLTFLLYNCYNAFR